MSYDPPRSAADVAYRPVVLVVEPDRRFEPDQIHAHLDASLLETFVGHREAVRQDDVRPVLLDVLDHRVDVSRFDITDIEELLRGPADRVPPVRALDIELDKFRRKQMMKARREDLRVRLDGLVEVAPHELPDLPVQIRRLLGIRVEKWPA